jgi:hypothetical protein
MRHKRIILIITIRYATGNVFHRFDTSVVRVNLTMEVLLKNPIHSDKFHVESKKMMWNSYGNTGIFLA